MASIPLPALNVRPPQQQADPVQQYGNLLALKNAMQEQPLRMQALQQQTQSGQLQLEQQQQAVKDQQAMTAAMQNWDGKDINQLVPLVVKNGASANAVMGLKQKILAQQQTYSKIAADDATTGSKNLESLKAKHNMVAGAIGSVIQMPDDQMAQGLVSTAQDLVKQGLLDEPHAQIAAQIAQSGDPAKIRQQLQILEKSYMSQTEQMDAAAKQAQMDYQKANLTQTQKRDAETAAYHAQEARNAARRVSIEGGRLAFEQKKFERENQMGAYSGLTGDAFLQTLPPGVQAQVKAMASGDIAVPSAGSRNQQAQMLRQAVMSYDPTFSDARYKAKQSFKNGNDSQSVVGLATAMEHLDRLKQNSDTVGYAPLIDHGLTEESTRYGNDAKLFTQEAGKLIKSGVVTEGEYKDLKEGLMSSRASIRSAAIDELKNLMAGKVQGVLQKYKTATGQDMPVSTFFDGNTVNRLKRFGVIEAPGAQITSTGSTAPAATHRFNPATGKIEAIQ
jgi:hypothetical protein